MRELERAEVTLIEDRNLLKWRINLIKRNYVLGWIKPV
jgi:hypothetical protein